MTLCDEDFMVKASQCIVSGEERVLVILALVVQEKMTLVLGNFDFGQKEEDEDGDCMI